MGLFSNLFKIGSKHNDSRRNNVSNDMNSDTENHLKYALYESQKTITNLKRTIGFLKNDVNRQFILLKKQEKELELAKISTDNLIKQYYVYLQKNENSKPYTLAADVLIRIYSNYDKDSSTLIDTSQISYTL